jgi:hypothetical protein
VARSIAALTNTTCHRAGTRRKSSSIFLCLVGSDWGSAGDVSTHAIGLSCESLPPVHDARHQLRLLLVHSASNGAVGECSESMSGSSLPSRYGRCGGRRRGWSTRSIIPAVATVSGSSGMCPHRSHWSLAYAWMPTSDEIHSGQDRPGPRIV